MDEKLKSFYSALKSNQNISGIPDSYDQFKSALSDENNRKGFHQALLSNKNISGIPSSYDDFNTIFAETTSTANNEPAKVNKPSFTENYANNAKKLAQDFMESSHVNALKETLSGVPSALDRILIGTSPVAPQILQKSGVDVSSKPLEEAVVERAKAIGNLPSVVTGNEPTFKKSEFVKTVEQKLANREPLTEQEKAYLGAGALIDVAGSSVSGLGAIKALGATSKLGTVGASTLGGGIYDFTTTNENVGNRALISAIGGGIGLITSLPVIIKSIKAKNPEITIKEATTLANEIKASSPNGVTDAELEANISLLDKYKDYKKSELVALHDSISESSGIRSVATGKGRLALITQIEGLKLDTDIKYRQGVFEFYKDYGIKELQYESKRLGINTTNKSQIELIKELEKKNFRQLKGEANATQEGNVTENNIEQYPNGDQTRKVAETIDGDSTIKGENVQEKGQEKVSKSFTTIKENQLTTKEFIDEFEKKNLDKYEPRSFEETNAKADAVINEYGIERAKMDSIDPSSGLTPDVRTSIKFKAIDDFNKKIVSAKKSGDESLYEILLDQQLEYIKQMQDYGTELGRGVSINKSYVDLLPDQYLNMYKKNVKAHNDAVDKSFETILGKIKSKAKISLSDDAKNLKKGNGLSESDRNTIRNLKKIQISPEVEKTILEKHRAIAEAKGQIKKNEAIVDLNEYILDQVPMKTSDKVVSLIYANVLAGVATSFVNSASTGLNSLVKGIVLSALNPKISKQIIGSGIRAIPSALDDALSVLKTGKATGTRSNIMDASRGIERIAKNASDKNLYLHSLKYFNRVMGASDNFFYKTAEAMKETAVAYEVARKSKNLKGKQLSAEVNDILGNTKEAKLSAIEQAKQEGYKPNTLGYRRRVNEITKEKVTPYIREKSREYGLETTYNQRPDGVIGFFANKLNEWTTEHILLKKWIPFTNVVANVTNRSIDLSPLGLIKTTIRYNRGFYKGSLDKLSEDIATGVLGTATMAYAAYALGDRIQGGGTGNYERDNQLRSRGWKPYSILINGKYYSYIDTPFALPLALIGNYNDAVRYRGLSEKDASVRLAYAISLIPNTLINRSFLSGFADLVSSLNGNVSISKDPFASTVKSVSSVPKLFIPQYVREITNAFDPTVYSSDDIIGALAVNTPIAGAINRPKLNVFGEPIEKQNRFISDIKKDKLNTLLTQKGAFIPFPSINRKFVDKHGDTRDMTPNEFYDFIKYRGQYIKKILNENYQFFQSLDKESFDSKIQSLSREANNYADAKVNKFL